jgi:hypothetical protein
MQKNRRHQQIMRLLLQGVYLRVDEFGLSSEAEIVIAGQMNGIGAWDAAVQQVIATPDLFDTIYVMRIKA